MKVNRLRVLIVALSLLLADRFQAQTIGQAMSNLPGGAATSDSRTAAFNVAACVWWVAKMRSPVTLLFLDLHISLAAVWSYFFWGFLLTAALNTALSAANVMHPFWTQRKATFRLLIDCAGGALFCWLLKANVVTSFSVTGVSPPRAVEIAAAINSYFAQALPYAIVFVIVIALWNGYRIFRVKTPKMRLTPAIL